MPTIEQKEKLEKVTVLLPLDTVAKLDVMAQKALMGSRGRVIQSLVDSLWESQSDIKTIQTVAQSFQTMPDRKAEDIAGAFFLMLFPLGNVISRINKYLGVTPDPVQAPQQKAPSQPPAPAISSTVK